MASNKGQTQKSSKAPRGATASAKPQAARQAAGTTKKSATPAPAERREKAEKGTTRKAGKK